jgi:hypothetical protein
VVYHRDGTINPVIPKPKHPAKVHVWGGISRRGTTQIAIFQGIMEKTFFTTEILDNRALSFICSVYPDGHRFQQDNDPKHRSKMARDFMRDNGINWVDDWPSESPDINPIEMVWAAFKRHIYIQAWTTVDELVAAILSYWEKELSVEACNKYIDHIFKVAPVCILMKGAAMGDTPKNMFSEQSFDGMLATPKVAQKCKSLALC